MNREHESYDPHQEETIELGECDCDQPLRDTLRFELPESEEIVVVACSKCGGLVEYEVPPTQTIRVPGDKVEEFANHLSGRRWPNV
jgi:hypothetical protein